MAMYGSVRVGERRLLELITDVGLETFRFYSRECRDYAERILRSGLRAIPNGVYHGEAILEDDGVLNREYVLRLDLVVLDETLIFDFRKTDSQARGPVNCPYGVTFCACANAIFNLVDPHVSHNEGTFRPLRMIVPGGSVLNCNYPAPLNAGNNESHSIVVECVLDALANAIPDRVPAPSGSTSTSISTGGLDEFGDPFTLYIWDGCGYGGMLERDGHSAQTSWVGTGSKTFPCEVIETRYPIRVVRRELRPDPGPGRHRGGLGTTTEYEILVDEIELNCQSTRGRIPPGGRFGGLQGQITEIRIVRDGREYLPSELQPTFICPTKFSGLPLKRGDRLVVRTPSGGGYGDPQERERNEVEHDLRYGYISGQAAVDVYGLARLDAEMLLNAEDVAA
jgi:N-methylhydantoinase B/oxoprolinase/acetone carboxylase alpha subunit